MIAMYNGFNTLDGYVTDYKKSYKVFRKIIEKELEKACLWRSYFDNWGGRCYVVLFPNLNHWKRLQVTLSFNSQKILKLKT